MRFRLNNNIHYAANIEIAYETIDRWCEHNGYTRTETVEWANCYVIHICKDDVEHHIKVYKNGY